MSSLSSLDKDSAKRDRQLLADALRQAGASDTAKKSIRCPFHEDTRPSATITQAASGAWRFNCYVCDISDDVFGIRSRVTGRSIGDVLKDESGTIMTNHHAPAVQAKAKSESFASIEDLVAKYRERNPGDDIAETNAYTDPETGIAPFYTLRINLNRNPETKKYLQCRRTDDGRIEYGGLQGKLPLFNRIRLAAADRVLIVEGEKSVRAILRTGPGKFTATTSPGGARNATRADWSPLAGKTCYVWRDDDAAGELYELDVIQELKKISPPVRIFRIPIEDLGLGPGGDAADYLSDEGMTNADKLAALDRILLDVIPVNAMEPLARRLELIMSGQYRSIAFPQLPQTSEYSKAMTPGCVVTLCGDPGAAKSLFVIEQGWRWSVQKGELVRLLMLEEDDAFHLQRAMAQMSGYHELLDTAYIAENAEFTRQVYTDLRDDLDQFARVLEATNQQRSLNDIAAWVTAQAENGVRIIIVDPITAAKTSEKPWIEDQKFLLDVKPVLERTGSTLLLTTHPRMGQAGKPSLSGMAGGAAYPRFSQTVFWLRSLKKPASSTVFDGYHPRTVTHSHILEIRKARNGKGQSRDIALNLNLRNLCFDELGVIDDLDE